MTTDKTRLTTSTGFPVKLGILTVVEGAILIVTGCLVTIWPLAKRFCPRRLSSALSCGPRARQHRSWYMTRVQAESDDRLTHSDRIRTRDGNWGSSPSVGDLEEQRWWVTIEGGCGSSPGSCESERAVVDHGNKL